MNKSKMAFVVSSVVALVFGGLVAVSAPAQAEPGYLIRSELNGKCLDIRDWNANDGAIVQMWACHGGANQQWYGDGSLIRSALNGKCLDIRDWNANDGAVVQMWTCHGGANQRWFQS
ncbi:RICIN domain-containing protein [Actinosynnema sp. NPDC059335]|uniref:RICIN domain-containing protein n=1 Tax=Actinosynnema sp. NPDC059335 TaxID=3346804 RepID=UPI00367108E8